MWMEALCKRRSLTASNPTHLGQGSPPGSSQLDATLKHTIHKATRHQQTQDQHITFDLDKHFCSCHYDYHTGKTTSISRPWLISNTVAITFLVIISFLINCCSATGPFRPVTTAVVTHPGISAFPTSRNGEEKADVMESQMQERTIPGAQYYEFFINEASYKFWAAFQLTTVFILLYSAFAAIYFAKYTFLTEVETLKEEDILLRRRRQLNSGMTQNIVRATTSLPYRLKDTN